MRKPSVLTAFSKARTLALTEVSLHPAPRQVSARKKIDHSSDGRTDGDQSRTEPESVNGARANGKDRTRQKKYTSERVRTMNHTTPIHPLCSIYSIELWRNSVRPISADARYVPPIIFVRNKLCGKGKLVFRGASESRWEYLGD